MSGNYFFEVTKKSIVVILLFFVSINASAADKPAHKKISRNISSVESVSCPNNTPAPAGNIEFCPKCTNGSYRSSEGCPQEGGIGDSCPQGGCNGGMPTDMSAKN